MNKSHFETTLSELQAQSQVQNNQDNDSKISRDQVDLEMKAQHEEEVTMLKLRIKNLELDLKDERLQRDTASHNVSWMILPRDNSRYPQS
jgi:protein subunit release factor A